MHGFAASRSVLDMSTETVGILFRTRLTHPGIIGTDLSAISVVPPEDYTTLSTPASTRPHLANRGHYPSRRQGDRTGVRRSLG